MDPSIGHQIDWTVAGPAVVLTGVLLVGGAYTIARMHSGRLDVDEASRPSAVASAVRSVTPLPVGLGTTLALEPGRGRWKVPVGPAFLAAIVGILGVIGTLTISHGLQDALDNPARAGVTWDAVVVPGSNDYGDAADELAPTFLDVARGLRRRRGRGCDRAHGPTGR